MQVKINPHIKQLCKRYQYFHSWVSLPKILSTYFRKVSSKQKWSDLGSQELSPAVGALALNFTFTQIGLKNNDFSFSTDKELHGLGFASGCGERPSGHRYGPRVRLTLGKRISNGQHIYIWMRTLNLERRKTPCLSVSMAVQTPRLNSCPATYHSGISGFLKRIRIRIPGPYFLQRRRG